MQIIKKNSDQFRWVILLLAVAVILPTICLLWFMMQAVKNERLAVRQKLVDVYQEKTRPLLENLDKKRLEFEQSVKGTEQTDAFSSFLKFCCDEKGYADAILIYDNNDRLIFPVISKPIPSISAAIFEKAWRLEFIDANYSAAAGEYEKAISVSSIPYVVFQGQLAIVRCYEKIGNIEQSVKICRELAYPGEHIVNEYSWSDIIKARLKLIELCHKVDMAAFEKESIQLSAELTAGGQKRQPESEVRIFVLSKLIEFGSAGRQDEIDKAKRIIEAETLSLQVAEKSEQFNLNKLQEKSLKVINLNEKMYSMLFKGENRKIIFVVLKSSVADVMKYIAQELSDPAVTVSVFDEQKESIFGENRNASEAFWAVSPSPYFGEWRLCFFFRDSKVFDQAAARQQSVYLWTGIIIALLIIAFGAIAAQAIEKQIRLNKLKNDFIATITHELKTPLASIRVLVDTLLEGRCQNQQQADEYLKLISKENKRLCHLIDNFLTFSRMERNKQVFDIASVSPVELANAAAEAIRTKFDNGNVKFDVDIAKPLPMTDADKDAMVTVLINLLDNAYKYSYDNKHIQMKVFTDDGCVCFSVKDNGIGMTRRQMKKIFDRFYQIDSSLSRRAEGTGLGLSIVKFIVDAHKGKIDVESKPGKGSEFTVRIPV